MEMSPQKCGDRFFYFSEKGNNKEDCHRAFKKGNGYMTFFLLVTTFL